MASLIRIIGWSLVLGICFICVFLTGTLGWIESLIVLVIGGVLVEAIGFVFTFIAAMANDKATKQE